jgi:hypothetical protein
MDSLLYRNKWRLLFGILLSCVLTFVIAVNLFVSAVLLPRFRTESIQSVLVHKAEILADLALLQSKPVFPESPRLKNAEPLLSRHIQWGGLPRLENKDRDALDSLYKKYPQWRTDGEQQKKLMHDPALKGIDTSWLEDLHSFDHWNLTTRPEVKVRLDRASSLNGLGRIGLFAALPLPEYMELRSLAYLRFFQLYVQGRGAEGLKTMFKVAELCHSSGTLVGQMVAAQMLKGERDFASAYGLGSVPVAGGSSVEAYRRLSWAWVGIAMAWPFSKALDEFQPYMSRGNGACTAAWEQPAGFLAMQDFFGSHWPLETDFSSELARSHALQVRLLETCSGQAFLGFLAPTPDGANAWAMRGVDRRDVASYDPETDAQAVTLVNLSKIPYLRRLAGMWLMTLARPNYMNLYEKK